MRVIPGPLRLIPVPTLQAEAQLNTTHELVKQRRSARCLKLQATPVAVLALYFDSNCPLLHATPYDPPPWQQTQVTGNRPLSHE